ncbi:MAG TPA: hypothetical protein VIT91_15690, partial [Chthoniobacterales bacterium]
WVKIGYLDWWNRGRRIWVWFVLGGLLFVFVGMRRPWQAVAWGLLIFTFIPLCVSRVWTLECNGLLAGWIAGFLATLLHRFCRRSDSVAARMERSEA